MKNHYSQFEDSTTIASKKALGGKEVAMQVIGPELTSLAIVNTELKLTGQALTWYLLSRNNFSRILVE